MSWFAHAVACSLYAVTFGGFLTEFLVYGGVLTEGFPLLGFIGRGLLDKILIVQSGEEVVEPGKNVPKAVFYSLAIVVPIYILVAFAAIGGIDTIPELAERAGVAAGAPTWQPLGNLGELGIIEAAGQFVLYGVPLVLVAGLTATMSALNATVYCTIRREPGGPELLAGLGPSRSPSTTSISGQAGGKSSANRSGSADAS